MMSDTTVPCPPVHAQKIMSNASQIRWWCVGGIGVSVYLWSMHFGDGSGACHYTNWLACDGLATGPTSMMLGLPMASMGVVFFLTLFGVAQQTKNTPSAENKALLMLWTVAGMSFLPYPIILEYLHKQICPWCTVTHIISFFVAGFAWKDGKEAFKTASWSSIIKASQLWVIIGIAWVFGVWIMEFVLQAPELEQDARFELAACMSEKGIVMFGSAYCGHCAAQKDDFGKAFSKIRYVECSRNSPALWDSCLASNLRGLPTWVKFTNYEVLEIEEGADKIWWNDFNWDWAKEGEGWERMEGHAPLRTLAEWSHCEDAVPSWFERSDL